MKRWQQKELVQSLRRQGLSYREILSQVPFSLSRSTISGWCKEIELSPEQLDRLDQLYRTSSYRNRLLGSKAVQRRRAQEVEAIKTKARSEVARLRKNELWLAGLMLYWAEGDKRGKVGLTNSDPKLVRVMMKWFRDYCRVPEEKFKVHLHLHSGHDEESVKAYWVDVTGLKIAQFGKSFVKQEGTGHRKNILYQGTIRIQIGNRDLLHTIRAWIEECSSTLDGPLAQLAE
ncbi:MAG: hypothetical protein HYZ89_08495, partial [Candidatus Omnitrophica bacterium]|nr:hypothetical protein [Candidatus Omnitrophota bacterium]